MPMRLADMASLLSSLRDSTQFQGDAYEQREWSSSRSGLAFM